MDTRYNNFKSDDERDYMRHIIATKEEIIQSFGVSGMKNHVRYYLENTFPNYLDLIKKSSPDDSYVPKTCFTFMWDVSKPYDGTTLFMMPMILLGKYPHESDMVSEMRDRIMNGYRRMSISQTHKIVMSAMIFSAKGQLARSNRAVKITPIMIADEVTDIYTINVNIDTPVSTILMCYDRKTLVPYQLPITRSTESGSNNDGLVRMLEKIRGEYDPQSVDRDLPAVDIFKTIQEY